jgi:hypothetical protein
MNLAHHLLSCLAGDRFRPAARALAVVRETLPDLSCIEAVMLVFDVLPAKNPVTWTAVIAGYSQIGQGGPVELRWSW